MKRCWASLARISPDDASSDASSDDASGDEVIIFMETNGFEIEDVFGAVRHTVKRRAIAGAGTEASVLDAPCSTAGASTEGQLTRTNIEGCSPFMAACGSGNLSVVRFLDKKVRVPFPISS